MEDGLTQRARARVGRVLKEKWRLDALLGVGGMAAVYSATHRNAKQVAIKMLHPELCIDDDVKTRFLREGYVANTVGHLGAVSVLDDDVTEDGAVFLVMELLDGETVEARAQRSGGRLPLADVLSIADQLLDVLTAAHAKGMVHRDLKPENLFLTRSGELKVLDFGIARLKELSNRSNATRSGVTMGTPAFMSPEQARGLWDQVDARTDIWAVGACMFTLLTGKCVHEGRTPNELLLRAMTAPAPALATVLPEVASNIASLVDRALSFEKTARWADARAMQIALRSAYHGDTTPRPAPVRKSAAEISEASAPVLVRGPATADPVAHTQLGIDVRPASRSRAVVFGGIGLLVIGIGVSVAVKGTSRSSPSVQAEAGTTGVAAATVPSPPAPSASSAAEMRTPAASKESITVADLPIAPAAPSKPAASGNTSKKPTTKAATTASTSKPDVFDKRR